MQISKYIFHSLTLILLFLTSCSQGNSADSQPRTTAREKLDTALITRGVSDARRALQYPEGSRERELQIIKIRAAEQRLRSHGLNASADAYATGADSLLLAR